MDAIFLVLHYLLCDEQEYMLYHSNLLVSKSGICETVYNRGVVDKRFLCYVAVTFLYTGSETSHYRVNVVTTLFTQNNPAHQALLA